MYKFQSVAKTEQQNSGPQKKLPLEENGNPDKMSNKEMGMDQGTNRRKGVEGQTMAVVVEARV